MVSQQRSVLGLVTHPRENTIDYAIRNQGAWLLYQGKKHNYHYLKSIDRYLLLYVCNRSHLNKDTQPFTDYQMISRGSSLKCLAVARVDADIYPRMNGTPVSVEEAGAYMLQAYTLQPLLYNKQNLLNPYFIVQRLDPKST